MNKTIFPSIVSGTVLAPASKSVAQRAIAIASLIAGRSEIINPGKSEDVQAALGVCRTLGVSVKELPGKVYICGTIKPPSEPLNCRESGLSVRMFSSIASLLDQEVILTGEGSLLNRPMGIVEETLVGFGVKCKLNNGRLPVTLKGPLLGGEAHIDGSVSSQVLTGMLIASPYAKSDVRIFVSNLQSIPYIDITINLMSSFGVEVKNKNYREFFIRSGQKYKPCTYVVEGDWSGASFFLVAGAIAGRVEVEGLYYSSNQADRAIIDALLYAGAFVSIRDKSVEVKKKKLIGFEFDATHCPDLFPPLVALATHCQGTTTLTGVSRLRAKESDRAATLVEEFSKLGVDIQVKGEQLIITGSKPKGGVVDAHGDHRIAMALAIAALNGNGPVEITGAEAVAKSYPEFFKDLETLLPI